MMSNQPSSPATGTQTHPAVIKAAIIEDRSEIREGLAALIGGTEGYR